MVSKSFITLIAVSFFFSCFAEAKRKRRKRVPKWKTKVEGEFAPQVRIYEPDSDDGTNDTYQDFYTRFQLRAKKRRNKAKLNLVARAVAEDPSSSQLYIKEAWWARKFRKSDLLIGANYFTWSALELFHPIDMINSIEIFEQDQIGEPMIMYRYNGNAKAITGYLLPSLTANMFNTSSKSRIGFSGFGSPIFVKEDETLYDSRMAFNLALEYKQSMDSFDYRLLYYNGPDRKLELFNYDGSQFSPIYFRTSSIGANLQADWWGYSWKFEFLAKTYQNTYNSIKPSGHQVFAMGFEYPKVLRSGAQVSYLIEMQTALGDSDEVQQYYTFQRDLFLGARYTAGDMAGTEWTAGYLMDLQRSSETALFFEFSRRLKSRSKIELGSRFVWAQQKDTLPYGLERQDGDNYVYAKWIYYFR